MWLWLKWKNSDEAITAEAKSSNKMVKYIKEGGGNIKRMFTKQASYAQVVMLCQTDLKITETNKNKNEAKFKF